MSLEASLRLVSELSSGQVAGMYQLMAHHYTHVRHDEFHRDLAEKNVAILLHETGTSRLCGFSTQMWFDYPHRGELVRVLYSGDTIIHPDHWGSLQLPIMFGRLMQGLKRDAPHLRLVWMLISKGFRTYRFLPVFFHRFYPRFDRPTPADECALMDALGRRRFRDLYDPETGLVRGGPGAQSLRPDLGVPACHQAAPDPHIEYFLARNPNHARGNELVCLAEFDDANLRPFILRQLNRERVELPGLGEPAA